MGDFKEHMAVTMCQGETPLCSLGRLVGALATLPCLVALIGCNSGPKRIPAPNVDPADLSEKLIDEFDANGNSSLSADELKKAPSLVAMFASYDADKNKELSTDELEAG